MCRTLFRGSGACTGRSVGAKVIIKGRRVIDRIIMARDLDAICVTCGSDRHGAVLRPSGDIRSGDACGHVCGMEGRTVRAEEIVRGTTRRACVITIDFTVDCPAEGVRSGALIHVHCICFLVTGFEDGDCFCHTAVVTLFLE